MEWLETIHLQAGKGLSQKVKKHLFELTCKIKSQNNEPGLQMVKAFLHSSHKADHVLFLFWDSASVPSNGSALGVRLEKIMNQYGLTDHNTWLPAKGDYHE